MKEYKRDYPKFSLCGLNCGLCSRYHTKGTSRCPGCGGSDFSLKHPNCAVITCSRKHDNVEYCFQCDSFPCPKYSKPNTKDSFISYANVGQDLEKAKKDLDKYKLQLNEKVDILEFLLNNLDDGRHKNFYCLAVNLLELEDLRTIFKELTGKVMAEKISLDEKIKQAVLLFENEAGKKNIVLKLRK